MQQLHKKPVGKKAVKTRSLLTKRLVTSRPHRNARNDCPRRGCDTEGVQHAHGLSASINHQEGMAGIECIDNQNNNNGSK